MPVPAGELRRRLAAVVDESVAATAFAIRNGGGLPSDPVDALHELQALGESLERLESRAYLARSVVELCWDLIAEEHQGAL